MTACRRYRGRVRTRRQRRVCARAGSSHEDHLDGLYCSIVKCHLYRPIVHARGRRRRARLNRQRRGAAAQRSGRRRHRQPVPASRGGDVGAVGVSRARAFRTIQTDGLVAAVVFPAAATRIAPWEILRRRSQLARPHHVQQHGQALRGVERTRRHIHRRIILPLAGPPGSPKAWLLPAFQPCRFPTASPSANFDSGEGTEPAWSRKANLPTGCKSPATAAAASPPNPAPRTRQARFGELHDRLGYATSRATLKTWGLGLLVPPTSVTCLPQMQSGRRVGIHGERNAGGRGRRHTALASSRDRQPIEIGAGHAA